MTTPANTIRRNVSVEDFGRGLAGAAPSPPRATAGSASSKDEIIVEDLCTRIGVSLNGVYSFNQPDESVLLQVFLHYPTNFLVIKLQPFLHHLFPAFQRGGNSHAPTITQSLF